MHCKNYYYFPFVTHTRGSSGQNMREAETNSRFIIVVQAVAANEACE